MFQVLMSFFGSGIGEHHLGHGNVEYHWWTIAQGGPKSVRFGKIIELFFCAINRWYGRCFYDMLMNYSLIPSIPLMRKYNTIDAYYTINNTINTILIIHLWLINNWESFIIGRVTAPGYNRHGTRMPATMKSVKAPIGTNGFLSSLRLYDQESKSLQFVGVFRIFTDSCFWV